MALDIQVIDETALPSALDLEIREFLCACFPVDTFTFSESRHWHGSAPAYSVICRDILPGLAGHVGVVVRTVRAGAALVRIFGIQNMAVAPDRRGKEVGMRLMQTVLHEAQQRGITHGVLFCVPGLECYYARTGWRRHDVPVFMYFAGQRNVPVPGQNICMVHDSGEFPFPDGPLHLLGADW
jgi:GNAT superfamily N-acetyltransferase